MRMNPFHVWLAKAQSKLSDYRSKRKNSKKNLYNFFFLPLRKQAFYINHYILILLLSCTPQTVDWLA